ncbi:MAG: hypothetical protein SXA11_14465 [Cyanobacteriota bacterium]|nr:hypothetical protein [Cyanobacteriota bacterium]
MKRKIIAAITLISAISLFAPTAVFSQEAFREDLEITDGEAQASVNPNLPIKIKLSNQTVKLIEYARSNSYPQPLPPGETVELLVKNNPDEDYLASILINTPNWTNPLIYDFEVVDNTVTVKIKPTTASNSNQQKSIYIDGDGHIYAF